MTLKEIYEKHGPCKLIDCRNEKYYLIGPSGYYERQFICEDDNGDIFTQWSNNTDYQKYDPPVYEYYKVLFKLNGEVRLSDYYYKDENEFKMDNPDYQDGFISLVKESKRERGNIK